MSDEPKVEPSRLVQLYQAFTILNSVMTIAEIEAVKAAVFAELNLTVPTPEDGGIENVSPLLLLGDSDGPEDI